MNDLTTRWTTLAAVFLLAGGGLLLLRRAMNLKAQRVRLFASLKRHCAGPLLVLAGLLGLQYVLRSGLAPGTPADALAHLTAILVIITSCLTLYRLTAVLQDTILARFDLSSPDNLRARQIHTQFRVMRRIVLVLAILLGAAGVLMTFERLQALGTGLFASAGVAGLVVGLSAQKTIGAFIGGIQLALTQPIRLDDVVVVEGEWGRIEEITLTYVVVRIWDQRRLVLPVAYFLDQPFQNWTRTSSEILGTVILPVDYTAPVDAIRTRLESICRDEAEGLWDGRVCELQVTDSGGENMVLRALVSAHDASQCWNLRCLVRERLVGYLQREQPGALPRKRVALRDEDPGETRD